MEKPSEDSQREAALKKAERRKLALDKKYKKPDAAVAKIDQSLLEFDINDIVEQTEPIVDESDVKEPEVRLTKDHFEPLALIGRGAFGEVRLVRMKDKSSHDIFAMKSMVKEHMIKKNQVDHVRAERDILTASENPWIVTLFYSFQDDKHLYMILEFLPGGDLMGLLMKRDTFSEAATKQYAAELVMAISYVHSLGYIHRDLKPDNILLDWDGHLKLTDMGLCKKVLDSSDEVEWEGLDIDSVQSDGAGGIGAISSDGPPHPVSKPTHRLAYSTVGTPDYISPEVILKKGYGMDCDWWSLGIILYECLVGHTPFFDKTPVDTCRRILRWEHFFAIPADLLPTLSPECIDFLSSLITASSRRLGRDGAEAVRSHSWFHGINWETLREQPAPFIPQGSSRIRRLTKDLSQVDLKSPSFPTLLRSVTANFDKFDDGQHIWSKDTKQSVADVGQNQFIGYTFKRKKDSVRNTPSLSALSKDSASFDSSTSGTASLTMSSLSAASLSSKDMSAASTPLRVTTGTTTTTAIQSLGSDTIAPHDSEPTNVFRAMGMAPTNELLNTDTQIS